MAGGLLPRRLSPVARASFKHVFMVSLLPMIFFLVESCSSALALFLSASQRLSDQRFRLGPARATRQELAESPAFGSADTRRFSSVVFEVTLV